MYITDENKKKVLNYVTESDILWDIIYFDKLKALIQNKDVVVSEFSNDSNSYGDFLFISIYIKKHQIELNFYGLGYHHYMEAYMYDRFKFTGVNTLNQSPDIIHNKKIVISQLDNTYNECKINDAKTTQSELSYYFNALSEIGDEDGAIALLEDMDMI